MNTEGQSDSEETETSQFEARIAEYTKAVNEGRGQEVEGMLLEMLMAAGAEAMADPSPDLV